MPTGGLTPVPTGGLEPVPLGNSGRVELLTMTVEAASATEDDGTKLPTERETLPEGDPGKDTPGAEEGIPEAPVEVRSKEKLGTPVPGAGLELEGAGAGADEGTPVLKGNGALLEDLLGTG